MSSHPELPSPIPSPALGPGISLRAVSEGVDYRQLRDKMISNGETCAKIRWKGMMNLLKVTS